MRIRTFRVLSNSNIGYRGAVLLILAVVDLIYGGFLTSPPAEQLATSQFRWRDCILPTQAWGIIWVTVGVVLLASAFLQQDRVGYSLAIGIKVGWAVLAACSALSGQVHGAWVSVAVWGAFAVLTMIEASRPEPIRSHDITIIDPDSDSEGDER